jgi:glycerol-3-phosphate acyltransferase PlsY
MTPAILFDPHAAGATAGQWSGLLIAGLLVLAYLLGGIPFGYLLVRLKTGRDVRSMGSGNIGATNVLRTTGRAWGVVTLLLDLAKGYVAV